MKNVLLSLLLLPVFSLAQKSFTVSGKLTGLPDSTPVRIMSVNEQRQVIASGYSKNGAFTLTGQVPEPGLYWLIPGQEQQAQHIFLENTAIQVEGNMKDLRQLRIEGSASHQDFDQFRRIFNPMVGELNAKAAQAEKADSEKQYRMYMKEYDSINKAIQVEVNRFVAEKPASFVTPFLLFITADLLSDPAKLDENFKRLDPQIHASGIGQALGEKIKNDMIGAVGTEALEFTQNDPKGQPVALSSFKGKYVLLDFWASWCKPCRDENPNVVKAFRKFNTKNFTVLGVSLDREKDAWLRAIEKDGLAWTQVSDLQFWGNEAARLYNVSGIPQNFLIDPNGKIIARNLRGEALEAKLCELLGCE
ncbi:MAG TPA: TlpA disulfide reductase family protein [Chitinophagaceae bacterium]|nr:TlpA disulfide reductase family protein [Chitinophagaceae bacterium]